MSKQCGHGDLMICKPLCPGAGESKSISHDLAVVTLLDVVTEQRVLIPDVEFAVRYHRMRPGRFVRAFRLIEPPALQVFLSAGFDQNNRAFLGSVVNTVAREGN